MFIIKRFFLIVLFKEGSKGVMVSYETDISIMEICRRKQSTMLLRAFTLFIAEQLRLSTLFFNDQGTKMFP